MNETILILGSNLGDGEKNISLAISELEHIGKVIKKTDILKNKAVEFDSENIFYNIGIVFCTEYSPIMLLEKLKKIEKKLGRDKDSKHLGKYEDRIIDIDIASYDGIDFYSKKLELPHKKHMYEREFSQKLLKELRFDNKKD